MISKVKIKKYFDAIKYGREDVILALLKDRIHIDTQNKNGGTLLMNASFRNDLIMVERCIELGANLDLQDKQGKTALIHAVRRGSLSSPHCLTEAMIITKLWLAGANADLQDNQGATALMYASYWGSTNTVKVLLALAAKNGINVEIKDNEGKTALIYATWACNTPAADLIKNSKRGNI